MTSSQEHSIEFVLNIPQAEKKKETALGNKLRGLLRPSSIVLILAWIALFGLLLYVQRFAKELSPFDPFDILKARSSSAVRFHKTTSILNF